MCLAATCLAISGFFAKLAMRSVDLYLAVTSRFVLPLLLTTAWLGLGRQMGHLRWQDCRHSVPRALALCLSQLCLYASIQYGSLGLATILYNTGPLFISLYSGVRKRSFSSVRLLALTLGFGGVLVMSGLRSWQAQSAALLTGVCSGFFQAASQILLHRATRQMGTTMVMFYVYLVGSMAWLGYLLVTRHAWAFLPGAEPVTWVWLWLLGSALGSMGNQQFRGEAYRRVEDPAVLSPLIYLSIAVSLALDHLVFQTHLRPDQWLGGGLIVIGALVSSRGPDK